MLLKFLEEEKKYLSRNVVSIEDQVKV